MFQTGFDRKDAIFIIVALEFFDKNGKFSCLLKTSVTSLTVDLIKISVGNNIQFCSVL